MTRERKTSPRLKDYDYHQPGAYFITICTAHRLCLFGEVENGEMHLNAAGEIALEAWMDLPNHYPYIELDEFIIMPNHIHGIIILLDDNIGRDRFRNLSLPLGNPSLPVGNPSMPNENMPIQESNNHPNRCHGLSEIVRGYKTWSARRINEQKNAGRMPVWMRSFYDHIVRDEDELYSIRQYIRYNATKWEQDRENPINTK